MWCLLGFLLWVVLRQAQDERLVGERQDSRPPKADFQRRCQHTAGWVRNYLTYFFVYSARCGAYLRAGSDSPEDTSGAMPVRSEVFERRLPPGRVVILELTGLAVDALNPTSTGIGMKRTFCLNDIRI